ncbi:MAG: serine/threonine-protein kinase [Vulcanimicrobiota bacterium]
MLKALVILILLSVSLSARPAKGPRTDEVIIFSTRIITEPPGALLYCNGNFVGKSGEPLNLDATSLGSTVSFTARLDGFEPRQIEVELVQLQSGRAPAQEAYKLQRAGFAGFLQTRAPLLGAFSLGLLVFGLFGTRHRRQVAELARREQLLATVDRSDSLTAQTLGQYRLLNILGKGGMATVYKAVPADTLDPSQAVAVKVLRKEIAESSEYMERFRQEARVTSRLNHNHIVRMIDWGVERDYVYLVVELIEGGDLRARLAGQPLPLDEVWNALQPICQAVAFAHSRGVVHRDLKPENLLITASGIIKVGDFGLARTEDQERLTATGTALGTPAYMAPEQIQGCDPQPSMDQYALGVIAYELVTGRLPFSASDPVQLIFKTISEPPTPPSHYARISDRLEKVLLRMLEKKPEARFASVSEAAIALEAALAG